ncbi:AraC family 4-hydroxyphenylacetate 3-monooxygenase operon regulatory protein [Herbaspirillum sp. Sphag1AN]|uniref:4-hydroxyphenylacetate catabolism regulatory protein HpaA n=1 Tax=unclassified Herbaspirillum TaxID=2624150 RepID=UPI0016139193|nr:MULTISPECIES: 4-hydroxyphenylacetate catabolism regulatory protein HpaA [unclassified Herbaspirillum]MBB3211778.1 AraC family 4-hydroxyphenylacetate 3-monooxygenase operon regulatory protein [Herbaspirillum sp. Sphag1AN]MBB3244388.1 AraC family 4-hydroxyphenylacetate 3-monooxygenase operon regulatory protein [Herbaspirillum sp. Sphag64]
MQKLPPSPASPALCTAIPNIDLGRTFDLRYEDEEVHFESLSRLADFFGRNMSAHRHDRVFQVHVLTQGEVRLYLDDRFYHLRAPLLFLTPPAVTHAFIISDDAEGHVLSVRQQLIWRLFKSDPSGILERTLASPLCAALDVVPDPASDASAFESVQLLNYFSLLADEFAHGGLGRALNLVALTRLAFVSMARLPSLASIEEGKHLRQVDVEIFQKFNQMIETCFRQHWTLVQYADALSLTETRLNDICRRVANLSSKRLVHDRVLQEAKRQLMFSAAPISEIAFDLGFKDVSYFSRFFRQQTATAPGEWRDQARTRSA